MGNDTDKKNGIIDWDTVHARLEQIDSAVSRGWEPSQEETNRILRNRAERLAMIQEETEKSSTQLFVVEFLLGDERYGIEAAYMQEVFPLRELTSLPGTPPFILGIINIRGKIIPLMDLKKFFNIPEKGITDLNRVLVIKKNEIETGILADEILQVSAVSSDELQPAMITLTGINNEYLLGITSERLIILDISHILEDPRIVVKNDLLTGETK